MDEAYILLSTEMRGKEFSLAEDLLAKLPNSAAIGQSILLSGSRLCS
jgi:hypothetical protein